MSEDKWLLSTVEKFPRFKYVVAEQKDYDRVKNITSEAQARKMANSIKDAKKLIRRTKAYIREYGPKNNPFYERMLEMGFPQIRIIEIAVPGFFNKFDI